MYSERVLRIKPYTPGEQTNENGIIKLNTNENPYPPSPECEKVLRAFDLDSLKLYPDPSSLKLAEVIAEKEGVAKENVFIGNGSDEVLALCFAAFFPCNNDKAVHFPSHTYSFYNVYCQFFGTKAKTVNLNDDFSVNVASYFETNMRGNVRPYSPDKNGVVLANPNAPTSILLEREKIEAIVKNNQDCTVLIDEAYVDFAPLNSTCVPLLKDNSNLVVVKTLSKSYSLAGLRVGYAIASENNIKAMRAMKDCFNSYPVDRIAEAVAIAALKDEGYHAECVSRVVATRERVKNELRALGYNVLESATNFLFAEPPSHNGQVATEYFKQKKVLVRHFKAEGIENFFRVSIGSDSDMNEFLRLAEGFLTVKVRIEN